jgi:hypothetical protein
MQPVFSGLMVAASLNKRCSKFFCITLFQLLKKGLYAMCYCEELSDDLPATKEDLDKFAEGFYINLQKGLRRSLLWMSCMDALDMMDSYL